MGSIKVGPGRGPKKKKKKQPLGGPDLPYTLTMVHMVPVA